MKTAKGMLFLVALGMGACGGSVDVGETDAGADVGPAPDAGGGTDAQPDVSSAAVTDCVLDSNGGVALACGNGAWGIYWAANDTSTPCNTVNDLASACHTGQLCIVYEADGGKGEIGHCESAP